MNSFLVGKENEPEQRVDAAIITYHACQMPILPAIVIAYSEENVI